MATVHRTFINRGKHEVTELKANYVYAVEYQLDSDTARTLGVRTEQVGLIIVNHYGNITHNYNLVQRNCWQKGGVSLTGKHVWYASEMEIDFATKYVAFEALCERYNNLREEYRIQRKKLCHYQDSKLHQIVESCKEFWEGIKLANKKKDE